MIEIKIGNNPSQMVTGFVIYSIPNFYEFKHILGTNKFELLVKCRFYQEYDNKNQFMNGDKGVFYHQNMIFII